MPRVPAGSKGRFLPPLLFAAIVVLAAPAVAQDFYEARLRAGDAALSAGQAAQAAEDLRIAAFGFLGKPALLCEALANLSIAQGRLPDPVAASTTLRRLIEVARGFPGCQEARLDDSRRAELRVLARKVLSSDLGDQFLAPSKPPTSPAEAPPPAAPRPAVLPTPTATAVPSPPPGVPPPSPPAAPRSAVPSEDLDRQPQLKTTTRAVYPESARRAGIGGIVLLQVLVSATGEPLRIEIARGVQPDLDQAAVAAVREWLFEPGRQAGRAVVAWMAVAVPFEAPRP